MCMDRLLMILQVDCYQRAVSLDQYLAVAYFQQGVSNFLMGDFEEALANFNDYAPVLARQQQHRLRAVRPQVQIVFV